MMGVGPLIAWRKASLSGLWKTFALPFAMALVAGCILVWAGVLHFYPVLTYSLCVFVLMTIMGEFHRGLKVQRSMAQSESLVSEVGTLFRRHRIRYGSHIVHFGVLVATIGITASMAHKIEKEFTLAQGESYRIGRFNITLENLGEIDNSNYNALQAKAILRAGTDPTPLKVMLPELRMYKRKKETTTEVSLRMGLREDVYLVLAGTDDTGTRAAFKLFINPLQVWLWFGTMIMLVGTMVVLVPARARERSPALDPSAERAAS
jgi:cytochrome c-type biogenesis protein CcmF